jgi:hypothetical protein
VISWFNDERLRAQARRDAASGVEANGDDLVGSVIGPRPAAPGETEDGVLADAEIRGNERELLRDDIAALDADLAARRSRPVLLGTVLAAFLIETIAAAAVLSTLGFESPRERLVLAVSIACASIALAAAAAHIERLTSSPVLRGLLRLGIGLVYVLLASASAWLRASVDDGGLDTLDLAATSLLLVAATATPSLVGTRAAAAYVETSALVRRRAHARRELRQLDADRDSARRRRSGHEREVAAWEERASRVRAVYRLELQRRRAELARELGRETKPLE